MPSEMGEVMATLLMIVDAWYELARDSAPHRFQPSDRVEVLGQLVRLLALRFHGFRRAPKPENISPLLSRESVGLRIRSPGRVPAGSEAIERELLNYGFHVEQDPNGDRREIILTCTNLAGARIISFPAARTAVGRRGR